MTSNIPFTFTITEDVIDTTIAFSFPFFKTHIKKKENVDNSFEKLLKQKPISYDYNNNFLTTTTFHVC